MTGPFDDMFGNTPFDLNHDGHIDGGEWAFINDALFADDSSSSTSEDDEIDDELEMAGLSRDDLEMMDQEERREALEDAGFDADDFEDEF
ncbi:hypothetical protein SAMN04487770_11725 [Butyrivibrio sp. ob235]|uniref:uroporphyrin-III methyltransferase n=1 Tax=Butyrivibrio sp. ob235 TaxID=1761780 RepID=UPI0008C4C68B|nr:uroporphyrin-III methyltransferase [Butyrivibrio sp. ob235]SEL76985.1 hypothetical protein SAMN04487770_11725 [Butyrivibrio sp. ob235]